MGCSNCKKKNKEEIKETFIKQAETVSKAAYIVFILWTILGFYGLVHLLLSII